MGGLRSPIPGAEGFLGTLTLPTGGRVYIDAQIIIYFVEKRGRYYPLIAPLWDPSRSPVRLVTSELSLLETIVAPLAQGNHKLVWLFESTIRRTCELIPIDQALLRRAAELRAARPSLRVPDAIHVASAQVHALGDFLTNDRRLAAIPGLNVMLLDP